LHSFYLTFHLAFYQASSFALYLVDIQIFWHYICRFSWYTANILTFYLTYILTFYPTFYLTSFIFLTVFLDSIWHPFRHFFWHSIWHTFWRFMWHSDGIPSDI
jgi:hypothetical protein